jgi:hypothetical protein
VAWRGVPHSLVLTISTSTTPTLIAISRRIAEVARFQGSEAGLYVFVPGYVYGICYHPRARPDQGNALIGPLHEVQYTMYRVLRTLYYTVLYNRLKPS